MVDRILTEEKRQQIFAEHGYDEQAAWENAPSYSQRRAQYERRNGSQETALNENAPTVNLDNTDVLSRDEALELISQAYRCCGRICST